MDRRRNIPLAIFLIIIFNCGDKSFSIESSTSTTNFNNNNIGTTVIENLVNGDNNDDNQKSDNTSQELSGFDMPKLLSFLSILSDTCNNMVNENNNNAESNIDTNNYRPYIKDIIQKDETMKAILCELQKYLDAVLQRALKAYER